MKVKKHFSELNSFERRKLEKNYINGPKNDSKPAEICSQTRPDWIMN